MRTCLGIIGVLLALTIVAALSTSWIVVYIDDREEGIKVLIPAPVFLADVAFHVGDVYADELDLPPEAEEFLPLLLPLVEELVQAPDFELLHVEESDLDVSIRKTGNLFDISVVDGDQVVRVKVPVSALERAVRAVSNGQLEIGELAGMLRGISRIQVVSVSMPDQRCEGLDLVEVA